jgi:HK97 family phage major capsid protein
MTDVIAQFQNLETKLGEKFATYENQLAETGGVSKALREDVKSISADYQSLKNELVSLNDTMTLLQQNGLKMEQPACTKTPGQTFVDSESFKNYQGGRTEKARVEVPFMNNTILGESGSPLAPDGVIAHPQYLPQIVGGAFRQLSVLDVMPTSPISTDLLKYTKENVWSSAAAETSQGAQKPEATLTFTEANCEIKTIPHFLKASRQILDDAPQLMAYINSRMSHGVRNKLEAQVIAGAGTGITIAGLLASGNHTALVAATADNRFDYANKQKYKVTEADYMADVVLINPADWGKMERTKVGSGDNRYVGADGAIGYINGGLMPTLWGLPVIMSNNVTAGKLITMSMQAVMLYMRQMATVEIFNQNSDDVEKNLVTIRAELRAGLAVFRSAAIVAGSLPTT